MVVDLYEHHTARKVGRYTGYTALSFVTIGDEMRDMRDMRDTRNSTSERGESQGERRRG